MFFITNNKSINSNIFINSNVLNFGGFIISHSMDIERRHYKNIFCLLIGEAYLNGNRIVLDNYRLDELESVLEESIGRFLFIIIDNLRNIKVFNSMYKGYDVYFYKDKECIYISSCIEQLVSMGLDFSLNYNYCYSILTNSYTFGNNCIFNEVSNLKFGTKVEITSDFIKKVELFNVRFNYCNNFISEVKNNILPFIKENTYLYFSGGLDSSIIFLSLLDLKINFTAIHIAPQEFESDTEIYDVIELCKKYDVKLIIIDDTDRSDYFSKSFSNFISVKTSSELDNMICNNNNIFFNGCGGDSVFLQNPDFRVGIDQLFTKGLCSCIKSMRELSYLKGIPFYKILAKSIKSYISTKVEFIPKWLPNNINDLINIHPLLRGVNPKFARFQYLLQILRAIELSKNKAEPDNIQSPFLYPNIINLLSRISSLEEMFNSKYDRLYIRNISYDYYKENILWKYRKRSSSMFLFNYYYNNKDELTNLILNSELIDLLNIDVEELKKDLYFTFNVQFNENLPFIHNFILLQRKINKYFRGEND